MMSEHPIQFRQAAGTLTVFIFVGGQAKPVKGVKVTITNTEGVVIVNDQTDDSGQTNSFALTTPEKSLSLAPANDLPYSKYNIKAEADGYDIVGKLHLRSSRTISTDDNTLIRSANGDEETSCSYRTISAADRTVWSEVSFSVFNSMG